MWKRDTQIQVWHHPPNQGMLSGTNPVCNHQLSSVFHQSNLQNSEPGKNVITLKTWQLRRETIVFFTYCFFLMYLDPYKVSITGQTLVGLVEWFRLLYVRLIMFDS